MNNEQFLFIQRVFFLFIVNNIFSHYFCSRKNIALWCNGSTSDSGSACLSSNLSRATKKA